MAFIGLSVTWINEMKMTRWGLSGVSCRYHAPTVSTDSRVHEFSRELKFVRFCENRLFTRDERHHQVVRPVEEPKQKAVVKVRAPIFLQRVAIRVLWNGWKHYAKRQQKIRAKFTGRIQLVQKSIYLGRWHIFVEMKRICKQVFEAWRQVRLEKAVTLQLMIKHFHFHWKALCFRKWSEMSYGWRTLMQNRVWRGSRMAHILDKISMRRMFQSWATRIQELSESHRKREKLARMTTIVIRFRKRLFLFRWKMCTSWLIANGKHRSPYDFVRPNYRVKQALTTQTVVRKLENKRFRENPDKILKDRILESKMILERALFGIGNKKPKRRPGVKSSLELWDDSEIIF